MKSRKMSGNDHPSPASNESTPDFDLGAYTVPGAPFGQCSPAETARNTRDAVFTGHMWNARVQRAATGPLENDF